MSDGFDVMVLPAGTVATNSWLLPEAMTADEWLAAGLQLNRVENAYSWWLGDWWSFGARKYGERKEIVESEDWNGPAYQTCMNAASVASAFETSRRREVVPFSHHAEIAALPVDRQEECLDWCEEVHKETGRVPSRALLRRKAKLGPVALLHTGDEESYTPSEYIESARAVMGSIDTDPASNPMAQKTVKAGTFYTVADDGLSKPWVGNVWLNPPYTALVINRFLDKLVMHYLAGDVTSAIALTNNNTDTSWFHSTAATSSAICFTAGRINFLKPDGSRSSPTNGQLFFYLGSDLEGFRKEFLKHGLVMVAA